MREGTLMDNSQDREEYKQAGPVNAAAALSPQQPEEAPEELTVSEVEAAPAPKKDRLLKAIYLVGAIAAACLLVGLLDPAVKALMIALCALMGVTAALLAIARSGHWEVFWYGFGRVLVLLLRFIFEILLDVLLHSGSGSRGGSSRGSGGFGGFGGARGGGGRTSGGGAGRRK